MATSERVNTTLRAETTNTFIRPGYVLGNLMETALVFDRETLRGLAALGPFPHHCVRGFQIAREARRVE